MNTLTEFLFPAPAPRRAVDIVTWWERRRVHYNAIVGAAGVFSLGFMRLVTWLPPEPREMPPLVAVLAFGVMANVCYFLGPVAEIAFFRIWGRRALPTGPTLFRMGLTFSVGLALLPTLITVFDYGFRLLRWLVA